MVSSIHFTSQMAQSQALTSLINKQQQAPIEDVQETQQEIVPPPVQAPIQAAPAIVSQAPAVLEQAQETISQGSVSPIVPFMTDLFTPQTQNQGQGQESIKTTLIKSGISLASLVAMFAIMSKMLPKMLSSTIDKSDKAPQKGLQIWEDLRGASKIEDMVLPQALKDTLIKIKNAIANPTALEKRGGKAANTLLLYGPPGTGKTTFAKALAKEFPDAHFAALDITKFNSKYHGETGKRINAAVDAICDAAGQNPDKKFFVFIDEIDSVMMVDDGPNGKLSNDILNEFKKCFTEKLGKFKNIITIGATNLPIDVEKGTTKGGKFLDRPMLDRFEQKILVGLPTSEQLQEAMAKHYTPCELVEGALKDGVDAKVKALCDFLAQEKHNVSFRTLNSIYNDTASRLTGDEKVSLASIVETIRGKKAELNIGEREWEGLLSTLGMAA